MTKQSIKRNWVVVVSMSNGTPVYLGSLTPDVDVTDGSAVRESDRCGVKRLESALRFTARGAARIAEGIHGRLRGRGGTMSTELTDAMLEELKQDFCVYTSGPLEWVFTACCDASQSGVSMEAGRDRSAARARLTEWLSSDDGLSTARSIGFICVGTLQQRVRELEAELSKLETCDTCEEPATRHTCRHHCYRR